MKKSEGVIASKIIKELLNNLKQRKHVNYQANVSGNNSINNPLNIAQSRYAKGEISKKEFDQMMRDFQNSIPRDKKLCRACGVENDTVSVYCIGCGITLD